MSEFYFPKTSPTLTGVYKGAICTYTGMTGENYARRIEQGLQLGHFHVEYITFNFSYCAIIITSVLRLLALRELLFTLTCTRAFGPW